MSSVSNGLYFLTLPLVSVMSVVYRKIRHARYLYIRRNVDKVWGAHYTLGARYLSKNTVIKFYSAYKVLQHLLYFSQNQKEMSAIYSVVDSECPTCHYITTVLLKFSFSTTILDHTQVSKCREKSKNLAFLPHPPYRPDLAPSDCHLFGALKDAFCSKRFGNVDEVTEGVAASTGSAQIQKRDRCFFFLLVQGC